MGTTRCQVLGGTSCLQAVVSALVVIANQWGTRLGLAGPCRVQTLQAVPQQAPGEGPGQPPGTSPTASSAAHLRSQQALQRGSGCLLQNMLPSPGPTAPAPTWVEPTGRKTKTAKEKENHPPSPLKPSAECERVSIPAGTRIPARSRPCRTTPGLSRERGQGVRERPHAVTMCHTWLHLPHQPRRRSTNPGQGYPVCCQAGLPAGFLLQRRCFGVGRCVPLIPRVRSDRAARCKTLSKQTKAKR